MDAIYKGAEFTIVAATGDARTGLPGVTMTPRKPQPWVELKERSRTTSGALVNNPAASAPDPYFEPLGITKEEYEETGKDREWLDLHRHGLRSKMKLDLSEFMKDKEIMETYDISRKHLRGFQDFADDFGNSIDEWMVKMKQMAQGIGIPLQELVPYILSQIVSRAGVPADAVGDISSIPPRPITSSSKIEKPLPSGQIAGRTILISTLEDPRITISNSEWTTRGWTYQEGVLRIAGSSSLSNRCTGSAFTSRNLSYDSDSLNAFLRVTARYSTDNGLYLMGVHLMGVYLMGVHLIGVFLMGVHPTGMYLIGTYGRASHGRTYLYRRASLTGVYLLQDNFTT